MSSSNYCFLTCIQVSQEAGQVVWYLHLFQNFPQFIVIHTVKGFGIVNKAEIDNTYPLKRNACGYYIKYKKHHFQCANKLARRWRSHPEFKGEVKVSDGLASPEAEVTPGYQAGPSPDSGGLSGCRGQERGLMAPARWDVGTSISAHSQDLRGFICRDEQRRKFPLLEQGRCPVPAPLPRSQHLQAQMDTFPAFFYLAWPRDWFWPMDAEKKRGEWLLDQKQTLHAMCQDGRAVLGLRQPGSLSCSMWGSCLDSCSDSLKTLQEQEASVGLSQREGLFFSEAGLPD